MRPAWNALKVAQRRFTKLRAAEAKWRKVIAGLKQKYKRPPGSKGGTSYSRTDRALLGEAKAALKLIEENRLPGDAAASAPPSASELAQSAAESHAQHHAAPPAVPLGRPSAARGAEPGPRGDARGNDSAAGARRVPGAQSAAAAPGAAAVVGAPPGAADEGFDDEDAGVEGVGVGEKQQEAYRRELRFLKKKTQAQADFNKKSLDSYREHKGSLQSFHFSRPDPGRAHALCVDPGMFVCAPLSTHLLLLLPTPQLTAHTAALLSLSPLQVRGRRSRHLGSYGLV